MGKKKLHLTDEERIVWRRTKGLPAVALFAMFASLMVVAIVGMYLLIGGSLERSYFWTVFQSGLVIFFLGVFITGSIVWYTSRWTIYMVTTKRILKTYRGKLVQETPLDVFEGRPLTEFMTKTATGCVNNQPRYSISIFGPFSGETILDCNNVDPKGMKLFENIGTVLRCKYCNTKNFAVTSRCIHCGAAL